MCTITATSGFDSASHLTFGNGSHRGIREERITLFLMPGQVVTETTKLMVLRVVPSTLESRVEGSWLATSMRA